MNCLHCDAPNMLTVETFKQPTKVIRTKKCRECKWTYTTVETIAEQQSIPNSIRNVNRKNAKQRPQETTV